VRLVVAAYFDLTRQKEAERRAEEDRRRQETLLDVLRSSLLPPHLPELPGVTLAARYHAATDEIGGDFYDVFPLRGRSFGLLLGDVCGQGPEAAVITSLVRYTLRGAAMTTRSPADAFALVNRSLLDTGTERFCTAVFARLQPSPGQLRVALARAGHPYPLVRRRDGTVVPLRNGGALLAVVDELRLQEEHAVLGPGDALVLMTDGVTEAADERGEELQSEGVGRLLEALPADASAEDMADVLLAASTGDGGDDDIAILVLQVDPIPA
jgi:sigma-B regulation protein RsbU (phosphoserine phosphatase)